MPTLLRGVSLRSLIIILVLVLGLPGALIGGWLLLNNVDPGRVGTPAHAGVISNGEPEDCTTVDLVVKARAKTDTTILLEANQVIRGTFGANGGFGSVDILLRVTDPRGGDVLVSPRASNYDFVFPASIPGAYTFTFDNRYSLITSKAVGLYYCIPGSGGGD
jgi:hypothetical protein